MTNFPAAMMGLDSIQAKSDGVAELPGGMGKRLLVVLPGTVLTDYKKFDSDISSEQVFLDLDMSTIIRNKGDS